MCCVGALFAAHVVGQGGHLRVVPAARRPVGLEAELAVGCREAVDEMRRVEIGLAVDPMVAVQGRRIRITGEF